MPSTSRDNDDDGDEFEHSDFEAHAMDANTADYFMHQFIALDEALATSRKARRSPRDVTEKLANIENIEDIVSRDTAENEPSPNKPHTLTSPEVSSPAGMKQ